MKKNSATIPHTAPGDSRYTHHPWRALLVMIGMLPLSYGITWLVLFGIFRLPADLSDMESLPTILFFTISSLLAYVLAPFLLRIPKGKCTFREYLNDIRLTKTRPFLPLLILTISCLLILIVVQGSFSIIYRMYEGLPVTWAFVSQVYNLSLALPPVSMLLFAQFFSMFEEVALRGVFLTMLLEKYSPWRAIVFSALVFGGLHLGSLIAGKDLVTTLGQMVWAFVFGLFYGYLFIKSGSLLPPMILHWLLNVFQAPLTAYYQDAPAQVNALGGMFGLGLAALLLIAWTRFFSARWLASPATDPKVEG